MVIDAEGLPIRCRTSDVNASPARRSMVHLSFGSGLHHVVAGYLERSWRNYLLGIHRLLHIDRFLDPRLLEMPGHDHDGETRTAIEEQRTRKALRPMGVKQMLPPVALYHLRNQH